MILWNPRLAAHVAEQRITPRIPTAHRTSPTSRHAARILPQCLANDVDFFRILLEAPHTRRPTAVYEMSLTTIRNPAKISFSQWELDHFLTEYCPDTLT